MKLFSGKILSRLAAAAALALLPGCATTNNAFPSPGANWQSYQGQLHYISAKGRSVIGDVVIRRSPQDDFQLEFQSGPGFPLIRVWESGSLARAEGALARGSWQGPPDKAPRPLRSWLQLRSSFSAPLQGDKLAVASGGDRFVFIFHK